ncbi:G-type lectin S-receptor-like serine/threonine-protein kinase At1g11410 [Silene latifolia]|uniref:G-type lectin S-receptor-like serine/threonine-protein kinase At1g11410 n=1 Tax=Silene latifolia TaxID=37657 RepID=UPI003D78A252
MILRVLVLLLTVQFSCSIDTITPTNPLKEGDILISDGGKYTLGFFSHGNSTLKYVGIWFTNVSIQTVVWVANRDKPVHELQGVFSISEDGNAQISSQKSVIWSTNVSIPAAKNNINSTSLKLLNSGNLVLSSDNGKTIAWQSFDHATDTFLPGMKLGIDKRTGLNRFLTSWSSINDPSPGNYTFKVDPNGSPQFFLYQGSNPVWRSGPWIGQRWSGVPDMTKAYIFNYSFVSNPDEVSVTYDILNPMIISIFLVDGVSGTVQRRTWHEDSKRWIVFWTAPKELCDQFGECGAYGNCNPNSGNQYQCSCFSGYQPKSPKDWYLRDGSQGCIREDNRSMCRNGEGFLKLTSVKIPDTSKATVNKTSTLKQCEEACLRNCSCTGYTAADDSGEGSGCISFYDQLTDVRMYPNQGQDAYFRADAVTVAKYTNSKGRLAHKRLEEVLIAIGVLTFVILISSVGFFVYQKKKRDREEELERSLWTKDAGESDSSAELPFYTRNEIALATDNFSLDKKLGEGGFGSVYKGQLRNGQEIAVKKLAPNSGQGIHEFKNEVRLIAKLQHRNLVKMIGCCVQGDEKMLIYEFMPNGSLDSFIFKEENKSSLDWMKRVDIIMGIARGMLYLHQDSRLKIIHRDLKASNILLDRDMVPKISDFGMARIFVSEQKEENTTRVVGTYGYMAPEYALEGMISVKSDVFSFGVLMLEVITGRKNSGLYPDNPSINLVGHVWELWKLGSALDIVDPSLTDPDSDEILKFMQVGLLCVQESADDRPTMSEVVFMLSTNMELPSPNQPAFIHRGGRHSVDPSTSSAGAYSVNDLSITAVVEGR